MTTQPYIATELDREQIVSFCRKWQIKELALFGSVLTDEFREDSDIDFLVTFDEPRPDWGPWGSRWSEMKEELQSIVGRRVDLVEKRLVEASENYIRRRHILSNQQTIYVAG
jgi:predicted nucleotidyltransferase